MASRLLLIRRIKIGVHDLLAFIVGSRRIGNNIFPLTLGRILTIRWCHSVTANQNKWVKILEEENTVKEG